LSVAVEELTGTVRLVTVAGRVNAPTTGTAVSGRVMLAVALRLAETLPAASLAQAKKVMLPEVVAITLAGAVAVHPAAPDAGGVALKVTM